MPSLDSCSEDEDPRCSLSRRPRRGDRGLRSLLLGNRGEDRSPRHPISEGHGGRQGPRLPFVGDHPCRQSLPEASSSQAWSGGRATCWPPSAGPARSGGATCWPLWGARAGWPADPGAASQADAALMSGRELHFLLFKTKIGGVRGEQG